MALVTVAVVVVAIVVPANAAVEIVTARPDRLVVAIGTNPIAAPYVQMPVKEAFIISFPDEVSRDKALAGLQRTSGD
jgi:hypothetical protein